jgi:hypothetical protein
MAILHKYDATANDSDKSFTVPNGKTWRLDWAHVILASTADVGNRQIEVQILDASSVLRIDFHAGTTQAANLTRHYVFQPGIFRETAFVDGEIQTAIPMNMILPAGWSVRFYDSAAVAATADDMTISFQITEHAIGQPVTI